MAVLPFTRDVDDPLFFNPATAVGDVNTGVEIEEAFQAAHAARSHQAHRGSHRRDVYPRRRAPDQERAAGPCAGRPDTEVRSLAGQEFSLWADQDPAFGGVWVPVFSIPERVAQYVQAR